MAIPISKQIERIKSTRFTMIPTRAIFDTNLSPKEKDLLCILAAMQGTKQFCWPSVRKLCELTDCDYKLNRRNIQTRLSKLEELGYIRREENFTPKVGAQTSNLIYVLFEPSHKYIPDREEYLGEENDDDDMPMADLDDTPPAVADNHPPAVAGNRPEKEEDKKDEKENSKRKSDLPTGSDTSPSSPAEECSLPRGLPHSSGVDLELSQNLPAEEDSTLVGSPMGQAPKEDIQDPKSGQTEGTPQPPLAPLSPPDNPPQKLSTKTVDKPVGRNAEMPFWGQVLGDLSKRVGQPVVTSWYGRLLFQGISDRSIRLKAPNEFIANYMNNGAYKSEILKSVRACGKDANSVKITS
jgi:hypothetical protein